MAGRAQESDSCQVAMLPDCAQCDKYWEAKFEVLRVKLEALREIRDLEKTSIDHRLSAMNEIREKRQRTVNDRLSWCYVGIGSIAEGPK